jgi:uncharacterized protein YggE
MGKISALRAGIVAAVALVLLALVSGYLWGTRSAPGSGRTVLSAAPALAGAATGSAAAGAAGITVTGTGIVSGTPDVLRLQMGVQAQASGVQAALDAANRAAAAVQASLRAHGVADKDLQTTGLTVDPQYTSDGGTTRITGYQASETLSALLRHLDTAGATVTAAAQAGGDATRIQSIALDLSDTGPLMTSARTAAVTQARSKAQQYASAAGVSLGEVVSLAESVSEPSPVMRTAAAAGSASGVPIATGSQQVSVTVTMVYAVG